MDIEITQSEKLKRNPSILSALDPVHRSILWKNLQFEEDAQHNTKNNVTLTNATHRSGSSTTNTSFTSVDNENILIKTDKANNNNNNTATTNYYNNYTNDNRHDPAKVFIIENSNSNATTTNTYAAAESNGRQTTENNNNTCLTLELLKENKQHSENFLRNRSNYEHNNVETISIVDCDDFVNQLSRAESLQLNTVCKSIDDPYLERCSSKNSSGYVATDHNGNIIIEELLHEKYQKSVVHVQRNNNIVGVVAIEKKPSDYVTTKKMEQKQKVITITIKAKQKKSVKPKKSPKVVTFQQSTPNRDSSESSLSPSSTTESRCSSPDGDANDIFHDCHDFKEIIQGITDLSDSKVSPLYSDSETDDFQTPTPTFRHNRDQSEQDTTEPDSDNSPLINIVQELSKSMTVTSTVTINKAKLKKIKSANDVRSARKQHSRKHIIDDTFCDEILAQTQHMSYRDYENDGAEDEEQDEESLSTEGSFDSQDSNVSYGTLEASPKYSGQQMGRLMARRLKKAEKIKRLYANYVNAPKLGDIEENIEQNSFLYERQKLVRRRGPQKPPRIFAAANEEPAPHHQPEAISGNSDTTMECTDYSEELRRLVAKQYKRELSQNAEYEKIQNSQNSKRHKQIKATPQPSCPTFEEIEKPQVHKMGWAVPKEQQNNSIPPDILNMLNYSDDERRKHLIVSSHSRAVPQKPVCVHTSHQQAAVYPKLDIDAVDGRVPPSPVPTQFDQFEANTRFQSTPRKHQPNPHISPTKKQAMSCKKFLDMERIFAEDQATKKPRLSNDLDRSTCESCAKKARNSFRKNAISRTKSFFEASKQKITNQKIFRHHGKPKDSHVFSDPETYCTPDKSLTTKMNQEVFLQAESKKEQVKHLGWTPEIRAQQKRINTFNTPPHKPARHSLHFQNAASNTSPNLKELPKTPPARSFDEKFNKFVRSPLKKLNSIKISPKKLFCVKPTASYDISPTLAANPSSYKSFVENDQDVSRCIMNEYLEKIRVKVEGAGAKNGDTNNQSDSFIEAEKQQASSNARPRQLSTSSDLLERAGEKHVVSIDLHNEPVYEEIHRQPTNNQNHRIVRENNKRYLIANNDPKAIYALVDKNRENNNNIAYKRSQSVGGLTDTNSEKSCHCASLNKTVDVVDGRRSNTTTLSKSSESIIRQMGSLENLERYFNSDIWSSKVCKHKVGTFAFNINEASDHDNDGQRSVSRIDARLLKPSDAERAGSSNVSNRSTYSSFKTNLFESEDGLSIMEVDDIPSMLSDYEAEEMLMASLGQDLIGKAKMEEDELKMLCKSSDYTVDKRLDAIEFYNQQLTMKQATQSSTNTIDHYEKPIQFSDQQSNDHNTSSVQHESVDYESGVITTDAENGYDTVDYSFLRRHYENQQITNSNKTDTTKAMESSPDVTINSAEKTTSPSEVYRSFKNKLRSSFRKSKKYLRYEHTRLANLFEDKQKSKAIDQKIVPSSNLEDYKKIYSDQKAERLYLAMNAKLQQPAGVDSTEDLSDQYMLDLIQQITNQRTIKRQLRNALEICRSRPEFECSTELIEAERLLLVSNLKEAAAKRQLLQVDYNNEGRGQQTTTKNVGTITLNHFEFPLTDATVCDSLCNYYYVCAFTYKDQVKATLAKEKNGDRVYFRNCEIKFWEVEPNFEIKMEVYALRLRKAAHNFSHESKFHLNKEQQKNFLFGCPSPPRLTTPKKLFSSSPSKSVKSPTEDSAQRRANLDYEFSHFKSQGCINITSYSLIPDHHNLNISRMEDIIDSPFYSANNSFKQVLKRVGDHFVHCVEDCKTFKLSSVIYNSTVKGVFTMAIRSEIVFEKNEISGFMNVGEVRKDSIVWNRRWGRIDGLKVGFWNDPQENDENPPIFSIDLTKCISDTIALADRSICARSRTFAVELFDKHHLNLSSFLDNNTKTYLLSTDDNPDLKKWMLELNNVLKFIKDWKV